MTTMWFARSTIESNPMSIVLEYLFLQEIMGFCSPALFCVELLNEHSGDVFEWRLENEY